MRVQTLTWIPRHAAVLLLCTGAIAAGGSTALGADETSNASSATAAAFVPPVLRYHLDQPAQVTLVIDDAQGQRVRKARKGDIPQ